MQKPVTGTETEILDWGWWKDGVFIGVFILLTQVLSCQKLAGPAGKTLYTESVLYWCPLHVGLGIYLQPVSCIIIYAGSFPKFDRQSVCITSTSLCSLPLQGDPFMKCIKCLLLACSGGRVTCPLLWPGIQNWLCRAWDSGPRLAE